MASFSIPLRLQQENSRREGKERKLVLKRGGEKVELPQEKADHQSLQNLGR